MAVKVPIAVSTSRIIEGRWRMFDSRWLQSILFSSGRHLYSTSQPRSLHNALQLQLISVCTPSRIINISIKAQLIIRWLIIYEFQYQNAIEINLQWHFRCQRLQSMPYKFTNMCHLNCIKNDIYLHFNPSEACWCTYILHAYTFIFYCYSNYYYIFHSTNSILL